MKDEIEQFIINNQKEIYLLAYSYTKNEDDALEIVQDAIIKALKSANSFKQKSSIKTWIYRIIINTALDFLRKKKVDTISFDDNLLNYSYGQEDKYTDFDLETALLKLPFKYQTIIKLHYFDGLTLKDIADILNEPLSTIKTRLYQAQKKLRISLDYDKGSDNDEK